MNDSIDFTQVRPPESRFRTLVRAYSHKPKNKFGDPEYVFMHVGKTGGTSVNSFFHDCHKEGLRVPIVLNHNWSYQMAKIRYPNAKIIVVLRDPLERIVSGFNFRLREGRPNGHPWSDSEAIAFSHFRTADDFLAALYSDNPREISAAAFCFRNINHLRRGYRFHFGDIHKQPALSNNSLHSIPMNNMGPTLRTLIQELNSIEMGAIPEVGTKYKSAVPSANHLNNQHDMTRLPKIKSRIQTEYETFNFLLQHSVN